MKNKNNDIKQEPVKPAGTELFLTYEENRSGGQVCRGQEGQEWADHEDEVIEVEFKELVLSAPCCPTCNRADPAQETRAVWTARSPQENLKIAYRAIVNGDRFFGEALLAFERDRQRQSYRPEPLRIL